MLIDQGSSGKGFSPIGVPMFKSLTWCPHWLGNPINLALLDLWWELYRTIRFSVARGAETLVRLKYQLCLSPNTQENHKFKHLRE